MTLAKKFKCSSYNSQQSKTMTAVLSISDCALLSNLNIFNIKYILKKRTHVKPKINYK